MNIAVLGAGMIGRTIALDLASSFSITCFDFNTQNLQLLKKKNPDIKIKESDLRQYDQYAKWLDGFDIIVNAVPGFMGFDTLKTVINCGKNICDISFFSENVLQLEELAR